MPKGVKVKGTHYDDVLLNGALVGYRRDLTGSRRQALRIAMGIHHERPRKLSGSSSCLLWLSAWSASPRLIPPSWPFASARAKSLLASAVGQLRSRVAIAASSPTDANRSRLAQRRRHRSIGSHRFRAYTSPAAAVRFTQGARGSDRAPQRSYRGRKGAARLRHASSDGPRRALPIGVCSRRRRTARRRRCWQVCSGWPRCRRKVVPRSRGAPH